ncbi:hypothetical protein [Haloferax sp. DFSO52]|uniref:hypothetical protein n=1 Tax=Haloferax sp. DFSO52 TaxID=3388505 RepID=UPI003A88B832
MKFERSDVLAVGVFLSLYIYLLRDIHVGSLYAFGDFPAYYGMQAIHKFLHTWHYQQLGYSYIYNALPVYMGVVTFVGGSLAQNLLYLSLIPAGFVSFVVFSRRYIDHPVARAFAAGVYALNPVTIGEFVNGGIGALIGFAGLPLLLHYLYKTQEGGSRVDALKASALFGATTISPWLGFWMVVPFASYLAYRTRENLHRLGLLVATGVLGIVLALPNVHHILQRAGNFDSGGDILFNTLEWNYSEAGLLSVLRLSGNRGIRAMNTLGYNSEPELLIGLVIPLVAALAWRRRELRVYFGIAGAIVGFMVATSTTLTYPLFEVFPPLLSLRNPVKIQYPLLVCAGLLFGAGVQTLLEMTPTPVENSGTLLRRTEQTPMFSVVVTAMLLLSLVSYTAPASGALGVQEVRDDDYFVPESYDEVSDRLDGRVMWMPYGYTTQLRLRQAYPNHVGIKSGGVLHGIQNTEYVGGLFADVAAGRQTHTRLKSLGVTYVVVDHSPPNRYASGEPRRVDQFGAPWLWGSPEAFETVLDESPVFTPAFTVDNLTVYRVADIEPKGRWEQKQGLHSVVYPVESSVERLGENQLKNPSFDDGLEDWWTPPASRGVSVSAVTTPDGESTVEYSANESADQIVPIAQQVDLQYNYPYRIDVDAVGNGTAILHWYDVNESGKTRVAKETIPIDDLPKVVQARGDSLSIRLRSAGRGERVRIDDVTVHRTTYPAATSPARASDEIPGVTIDGRNTSVENATTVVVNGDDGNAPPVDADVRIIDAETVLDGELVFGSQYRQGVAVVATDSSRPPGVPASATAVTYETDAGTVVDYWRDGTFDDRQVTVVRTSYDEQWISSSGTTHFRANGWMNGFVGSAPDDVSWTGGFYRPLVVRIWALAWLFVLLALFVATAREPVHTVRSKLTAVRNHDTSRL